MILVGRFSYRRFSYRRLLMPAPACARRDLACGCNPTAFARTSRTLSCERGVRFLRWSAALQMGPKEGFFAGRVLAAKTIRPNGTPTAYSIRLDEPMPGEPEPRTVYAPYDFDYIIRRYSDDEEEEEWEALDKPTDEKATKEAEDVAASLPGKDGNANKKRHGKAKHAD